MHGARVVAKILSEPSLRAEWLEELREVTGSIPTRRAALREALEKREVPGDWSFLTSQKGMFSLLPLTPE